MPERKETCKDCGAVFVISEMEQLQLKLKKFDLPKRCPECRQRPKNARPVKEASQVVPQVTSRPAMEVIKPSSTQMPPQPGARASVVGRRSDYLEEGYFTISGELRPEIFAQEARLAVGRMNNDRIKITSTALRRFYNRLKAIEMKQSPFDEKINDLRGLVRDAEYSKNRGVIPQALADILQTNCEMALRDEPSLMAFIEHFKSIVAYAKTDKNQIPALFLEGRDLPSDYLNGGYYLDERRLRREVFVEWAEALVGLLASRRMTMTSLRRFYTKLKAIQQNLATHGRFERTVAELYSLERDAVYAAGREVVPPVFAAFIARNVGLACQSSSDFKGFIEHFQSVVAYGRGRLSEGGSRA